MLEIGGIQLLATILIIAFFFIVFHVIRLNWEMKVYENRKKAADESFVSGILDLAKEQEQILYSEKIDVVHVTRDNDELHSLPDHRIAILQPEINLNEKLLTER